MLPDGSLNIIDAILRCQVNEISQSAKFLNFHLKTITGPKADDGWLFASLAIAVQRHYSVSCTLDSVSFMQKLFDSVKEDVSFFGIFL